MIPVKISMEFKRCKRGMQGSSKSFLLYYFYISIMFVIAAIFPPTCPGIVEALSQGLGYVVVLAGSVVDLLAFGIDNGSAAPNRNA